MPHITWTLPPATLSYVLQLTINTHLNYIPMQMYTTTVKLMQKPRIWVHFSVSMCGETQNKIIIIQMLSVRNFCYSFSVERIPKLCEKAGSKFGQHLNEGNIYLCGFWNRENEHDKRQANRIYHKLLTI